MLRLKPPPKDPKRKRAFRLRQSTLKRLDDYAAAFSRQYNEAMPVDDMVDQMLVAFMAGDKAFRSNRPERSEEG